MYCVPIDTLNDQNAVNSNDRNRQGKTKTHQRDRQNLARQWQIKRKIVWSEQASK